MKTTAELARAAIERLSEDETLRGELDDATFEPLFEHAIAAIEAAAESGASTAMLVARIKEIVAELREDVAESQLPPKRRRGRTLPEARRP